MFLLSAGKAHAAIFSENGQRVTVRDIKAGEMFVKLSALKGEVKAGETVKLTLTTDGGVAIPLAAVVK